MRAHRGGMVRMHETHDISVDSLDALISRLQADGYRSATPASPEFEASLR